MITLRDYQIKALNKLKGRISGGVLREEFLIGAHVLTLKVLKARPRNGGSLIVCTDHFAGDWRSQCLKPLQYILTTAQGLKICTGSYAKCVMAKRAGARLWCLVNNTAKFVGAFDDDQKLVHPFPL